MKDAPSSSCSSSDWWKHALRIGVYSCAFFSIGWALALPGASLAFLATNVRRKEASLGVLFTGRGAAYASSSLVGGVLGEAARKTHVIMATSMSMAAVGMWCASRSTSLWALALSLTCGSVAMGSLDTVGNMATLRSCERAQAGTSAAMSVVHASFGAGCIAAPGLLRRFFAEGAEQSAYNACSFVCAACAVALCLTPAVPSPTTATTQREQQTTSRSNKKSVGGLTGFAASLLIFIYVGVEQGTGALLSTWAFRSIELPRQQSLDLTSVLWFSLVFGRLFAGLVVPDDVRADILVMSAIILAVLSGFALAFCATGDYGLAIVAPVVFCLGCAYGPIYPVAFARLEARLEGRFTSTFGGVVVAMGGLGEMALPLLIFRAWQTFGPVAFGASICVLSLVCVVCWAVFLTTTSRSQLELLQSRGGHFRVLTSTEEKSMRRRRVSTTDYSPLPTSAPTTKKSSSSLMMRTPSSSRLDGGVNVDDDDDNIGGSGSDDLGLEMEDDDDYSRQGGGGEDEA